MVNKGREPSRCRSRSSHGLTNSRPFEDKVDAYLFVIGVNKHHPFWPVNSGGWFGLARAGAAKVEGAMGIDVPYPVAVAFRLASRSAIFFFLSLLKPISANKQQVNTGYQQRRETASKYEM